VSQSQWQVEADAAAMLEALRAAGCRLGIVSNASDDEDVQILVDQAEIRPYFDFILTSAVAGYRKPSPHIFRQALAFWGARPEECVMIGDTLTADVVGANGMGIASVWITRRAGSADPEADRVLYNPTYTIEALSDLPSILL
jgi:putative hydrolase of the HAD superfamily